MLDSTSRLTESCHELRGRVSAHAPAPASNAIAAATAAALPAMATVAALYRERQGVGQCMLGAFTASWEHRMCPSPHLVGVLLCTALGACTEPSRTVRQHHNPASPQVRVNDQAHADALTALPLLNPLLTHTRPPVHPFIHTTRSA